MHTTLASSSSLMISELLVIVPHIMFNSNPGENTELNQYIAIHATLAARDFFLYFYLSGPFICIFPKPLPIFSFLCRPAE